MTTSTFTIQKGAHQTAVLVRAQDTNNERVKRLLESINRPNTIKADIETVPNDVSLEAATALATAAGYVLVLSAQTGSGAAVGGAGSLLPNLAGSDPDDPDSWGGHAQYEDGPDF